MNGLTEFKTLTKFLDACALIGRMPASAILGLLVWFNLLVERFVVTINHV